MRAKWGAMLVQISMQFKPEVTYDAVTKVWSGPTESNHFAPDLSIGEIIFYEMQRHPNQIAQVCIECDEIKNYTRDPYLNR